MNCGICYQIYVNPKIFSCGHSFCLKCTINILKENLKETYPCPKCPFCKQNILEINHNFILCDLISKISEEIEPENMCLTLYPSIIYKTQADSSSNLFYQSTNISSSNNNSMGSKSRPSPTTNSFYTIIENLIPIKPTSDDILKLEEELSQLIKQNYYLYNIMNFSARLKNSKSEYIYGI